MTRKTEFFASMINDSIEALITAGWELKIRIIQKFQNGNHKKLKSVRMLILFVQGKDATGSWTA